LKEYTEMTLEHSTYSYLKTLFLTVLLSQFSDVVMNNLA